MRDINQIGKFRGQRKDNGEWIDGYLFVIWEKAYILWGTTNGVPNMIEVIPETVGEFTGLPDRNGKEIYEGDVIKNILNDGTVNRDIVEWNNKMFRFVIRDIKDSVSWGFDDTNNFEVIGNVFENPELIAEVDNAIQP